MKYLSKTQPHPVLQIEMTTWELERVLEVLQNRSEAMPTHQERLDLIKGIERLLVTATGPRP